MRLIVSYFYSQRKVMPMMGGCISHRLPRTIVVILFLSVWLSAPRFVRKSCVCLRVRDLLCINSHLKRAACGNCIHTARRDKCTIKAYQMQFVVLFRIGNFKSTPICGP